MDGVRQETLTKAKNLIGEIHRPQSPAPEIAVEGLGVDGAALSPASSTITPSGGASGRGKCGRCFSRSLLKSIIDCLKLF